MATTQQQTPPAGAEIPAILTKRQAADYVCCTPRYLETQIRLGRLKPLKPTGKLVRIRRADLEKFLESGATIGGDL
jgi:excisionase family DNA binding protein